jgi:ABC-type nitrate/sulfonate/bicarbonate transport system substrate-binding protein
MDWETWAREAPGAVVVPLDTDALQSALADGSVDAVVGWDPWVERWLREVPGTRVLAERPFHSVLAVSTAWAAEAPVVDGSAPAARLLALVEDALALAAREGAAWDAEVARVSGVWTPEVVGAVVARNRVWRDGPTGAAPPDLARVVWAGLARAAAFARLPVPVTALDGSALLRGERPPRRGGGKGPPRPPGAPR